MAPQQSGPANSGPKKSARSTSTGKAGRASASTGKAGVKERAIRGQYDPEQVSRPKRTSPDLAQAPLENATGRLRTKVRTRTVDRPWKAWIIAGGWLLAVWFALWGAITPMLALTGIAVAVAALALFPLPIVEFTFGLHPVRALILVGRFLLDVLVASAQVAWLAVRPRLPQSEITTVQLRSTSDLIQTLTSLAVSLVPGSLIIDADPDHRTLKIHVLDPGPGGLRKFHQSVLDQEERIVRALGGAVEIDAVMGVGEPDERAVHVGHIAWGPAGLAEEKEDLEATPEAQEQSDLVAMDAEVLAADEPEIVVDADRPPSDSTKPDSTKPDSTKPDSTEPVSAEPDSTRNEA